MFSPCVGVVLMKVYQKMCNCHSSWSSTGTIYVILHVLNLKCQNFFFLIQNQFINHLQQFVQLLLGYPTQRIIIFPVGLYGCEILPLHFDARAEEVKKWWC
jgi:hypothetical protein